MILIPEYLKKFKCIGSKCEDTCCREWKIDIDKKTYNFYKKNKNLKLKHLFKKYIKRYHNNLVDRKYGKIIMDNKGQCPFLDENKLCGLYAEIGENSLSEICKNYPRETTLIDKKLEQCLTMSCPEAVRLSLFNKEGIIFENIDEKKTDIKLPKYTNRFLDTKDTMINGYFWDIRIFSLNLLQNRKYTLDERMAILGIIYYKIKNLIDNKNYNEILILLENMDDLVQNMAFKEQIKNIPVNYQLQMRIIKELIDEKIITGVEFESCRKFIVDILKGIKFKTGGDIREVLKEYEKSYLKYLKPYIKEKEYVIENFIVNEFFRLVIPFGDYQDIWDSYMHIATIYSMLKFYLIGISALNKKINDDIVVKTIYIFSRMMLHSEKYMNYIIDLLKKSKVDTLAYMCIFVKS